MEKLHKFKCVCGNEFESEDGMCKCGNQVENCECCGTEKGEEEEEGEEESIEEESEDTQEEESENYVKNAESKRADKK